MDKAWCVPVLSDDRRSYAEGLRLDERRSSAHNAPGGTTTEGGAGNVFGAIKNFLGNR